jgi:two-component system sensor histidine kinase RegB
MAQRIRVSWRPMSLAVTRSSGPILTPAPGRVRVRTLVITRWLAVIGQLVALLVVSEGLHAPLPMFWAMATVACSALLNVWVGLSRGLNGWHSEREAAFFLGYDLLQLAVLLFLTGGLENPFSLLFLVPVTISATILGSGSTVWLTLIAFICITVLARFHLPLPSPVPGFVLPAIFTVGTWVALSLGMAFLTFYAWRVAAESRRMSDALAETQLTLAREQTLSSLGALAAAAAHELGTPLGTIALVAAEMARELPRDSEYRDDIELLNSQVARCREILARLAANPMEGEDEGFPRVTMRAMAVAASDPFRHDGVTLVVQAEAAADDGQEPLIRRSPEMQQGLANLIENAFEFARAEVRIKVDWDAEQLRLEITDDGPGFAPIVLGDLGEPYVSTRREHGRMGLGVFISKTLLERTGAAVRFSNPGRGAGARVAIAWPRRAIEWQAP